MTARKAHTTGAAPAGERCRTHPVLVVGRGLIGSAVRQRLLDAGRAVVTIARCASTDPAQMACDLANTAGRRQLRAELQRLRPTCTVLAHGPSDVTWTEQREAEAEAIHRGVAEILAEAEAPVVLVSTDNVFDGLRGRRSTADEVSPQNAYGRVKLKAERALLAVAHSLVLRSSLVYGWTGARHRSCYGQRCLESALRKQQMHAPTDQIFTPIHVADVAAVIAALCQSQRLPTGVAHLSGPQQLSRFDFAKIAYDVAGADERLVRPCLRRDTELASRPMYSSLMCDDFAQVAGLARWRPIPPRKGLRRTLQSAPWKVTPQ